MADPRGFAKDYFIGGLLFILLSFPLTGGVNPPPKFTKEFDVSETGDPRQRWDSAFRTLIQSLRRELRYTNRWGRLGLPVLSPQAEGDQAPTQWFHLVLRYSDAISITVRIRGDNLYVVGFQRHGSDQWLELRPNNARAYIEGSTAQGFSCNYNHLVSAANQDTNEIALGRYRLRDAVIALADETTNSRMTARSILVVILMICESTRFPEIAEHFIRERGREHPGGEGDRPRDPRLSLRMDALTRGWGDISQRLIRADQDPEDRNTFPLTLERAVQVVIPTAQQAAAILGILLLRRNCMRVTEPIREFIPALVLIEEGGVGAGGGCGEGRPLLEVTSVVIIDIDQEDPGQLYGTIRVTDGLGPQSIYSRDAYDYEKISPGQPASLNGPDRAISALGDITIDLDLWDRDFTLGNNDDQVSKGSIDWNHLDFSTAYDRPLSQDVTGASGSVTVNYIVFSDAVEAKFHVTLIKGNDGEQDEVYGRIAVLSGDRGIESVLFSRTTNNYVQVTYGQEIPLSKTVVAVPLSSYIQVRAKLYDYDSSSADDEITGGCTYFGTQSSGRSRWRITGESGEIEVKVIWNPSY